jgi:hypothetical protein
MILLIILVPVLAAVAFVTVASVVALAIVLPLGLLSRR